MVFSWHNIYILFEHTIKTRIILKLCKHFKYFTLISKHVLKNLEWNEWLICVLLWILRQENSEMLLGTQMLGISSTTTCISNIQMKFNIVCCFIQVKFELNASLYFSHYSNEHMFIFCANHVIEIHTQLLTNYFLS